MGKQIIRASCWAIIKNPNEQILMLKRSKKVNNPNLWNLPGGNVDDGETPQRSVLREVEEEAGIILKSIEFTRVLSRVNSEKIRVNMFFYTHQLDKDIKVTINEESSKYQWLDVDAIKKLNLHPPTQQFFKG